MQKFHLFGSKGEVIYLNAMILIHSFMFWSLCSGRCGFVFLRTELFLGPASSIDCPIFPSGTTPRDDEVAKLANERDENKMH